MPSSHHTMFDDAANIKARLRIADAFPMRQELHKHARTIIELQDGRIDTADIQLAREERVWGRYIGCVIGNPDYAEDEKVPVGIKLPPLYFRPLFHLERALRDHAAGRECELHLPKTVEEIEEYLHEAMEGVFRDGTEEEEVRLGMIANGEGEDGAGRISAGRGSCKVAPIIEEPEFEEMVGVTIRSLARFLVTLRMTNQAMFLLLLSLDIEEAKRTMPCLDYIGGRNEASEWRKVHFLNAKCSILAIFEIIRILRRGTALAKALSAKRRFTVSEVRSVVARLRQGKLTKADLETLETLSISTYGLRKIVLNDIDRHHKVRRQPGRRSFRRRATDDHTLLSLIACLNGPDAAYAIEVAKDFEVNAVSNVPVAGVPRRIPDKQSAIDVTRIAGAGKKQQDALCAFYGYTPRDLATLAAIEAVAVVGQQNQTRFTSRLASLMDRKLLMGEKGLRSRQVVAVRQTINHVFPPKGMFRHSCGFARSSWVNLDEDAALWLILTEGKRETGAGDPYADLFVATRHYLQQYSYGVSRLDNLGEAARIFCHLSHTMGCSRRIPSGSGYSTGRNSSLRSMSKMSRPIVIEGPCLVMAPNILII